MNEKQAERFLKQAAALPALPHREQSSRSEADGALAVPMKTCPCCGSIKITSKYVTEKIAAQLGPQVEYIAVEDTCNDCMESGDFDAANDEKRVAALCYSERLYMQEALPRLHEKHGFHNIERALRLSQRTMKNWNKTGYYDQAAVVLVRLIDEMPSLLAIVDNDFIGAQILEK